MTIKRLFRAPMLALLVAGSMQTAFSQTVITQNTQGTHDGFFYSFWTENPNDGASMTLGPDGNYSTTWNNTLNFTAGKGWAVGKVDRTICFEGTYDGGSNGFLAVYGWTKDPLIEYYVCEKHGAWEPPGNTSGVSYKGTYNCDGGTYKVYTGRRENKPSIIGNASFDQYWSVRQEQRSTGTVTFADHVAAWEAFGMAMGTTYDYQIMESEGYTSSGSSNITVWECKANDIEVELTAPTATDEFLAPASISLTANASTPSSSISKVEFYNGTTKLGEDASAPYEYTWTNVAKGSYSISATAIDANGDAASSNTVVITVNVPQAPYGGTAHAIPGVIEFEEFDEGGNNSSYYDDSPGTSADPAPNFRSDEDVDIEECQDTGDGYNLGYTTAGEWLEYTVDVASAGSYNIEIRAASEDADKTISLETDGTPIVTDLIIPTTGGWQTWESVIVEDVQLEAGQQVIRVTIGNTDYVNLNKMTFTVNGTPPSVSIQLPDDASSFFTGETIMIGSEASSTVSSIDAVTLYVDNQLIISDDTAPYSFEWSTTVAGEHTIKVVATDMDGATSSASETINIEEKPASIQLKKGWNLVGFPGSETTSVEDAFTNIMSQLESVKDMDGFWNKTTAPALLSLTELEWGRGYYIKVNANCELIW